MKPLKVALVGYGVEGHVSFKYWQAKSADITICDINTNLKVPPGIATQLGPNYLHDLSKFDVIMRGPGTNPNLILAENPKVKPKITTLISEFLAVSPTKNIIGVTGTKGKGTTSTLIAKMLEAAGKTVFLGGNVGQTPFEFLDQLAADSWVVLELSSFQLYDISRSPHIGVCLYIAPEHLNWHSDMDDYVEAKAQLFAHQTPADIAIYYAGNTFSKAIAARSPGKKIGYFAETGAHIERDTIVIDGQTICRTDELKLLGRHNWQNACAAVTAAWQVAPDITALRHVLTSFAGLEHRLEFVREIRDVNYYDDSFSTTPETAIAAIEAFAKPKIVILGGSDKGATYNELAQIVKRNNVRQVILIGNTTNKHYKTTAPEIKTALHNQGFTAITTLVKPGGHTMSEIVAAAADASHPGDVVLLSPACASFDMFISYKDRAAQFQKAVSAL